MSLRFLRKLLISRNRYQTAVQLFRVLVKQGWNDAMPPPKSLVSRRLSPADLDEKRVEVMWETSNLGRRDMMMNTVTILRDCLVDDVVINSGAGEWAGLGDLELCTSKVSFSDLTHRFPTINGDGTSLRFFDIVFFF